MSDTEQPPEPVEVTVGRQERWSSGGGRHGVRLAVIAVVVVVVVFTTATVILFSRSSKSSTPSPPRPTPTAAPSAALQPPSGLFATGSGGGGVVLSWQPARPAPVGYRIYRADGGRGPFAIVGSVNAPDLTTFADTTDLVPGTTYAYTVTSFDRRQESRPTGPIVAVLVAANTTPSPTPGIPQPPPTFQPPTAPTLTALAQGPRGQVTPLPTLAAPTGVAPTVPPILPTSAVGTPPAFATGGIPTALATAGIPTVLTTATAVTVATIPPLVPPTPSASPTGGMITPLPGGTATFVTPPTPFPSPGPSATPTGLPGAVATATPRL